MTINTTIRPLSDRVIVRRDEAAEQTQGGIILVETAREAPATGTVVAVGPGRVLDSGQIVEPRIKEGDRILFSIYAGTELSSEGEEAPLIIMREDDIYGVYDPRED